MIKCRCSKIKQIDTGPINILLKDCNKNIDNSKLFEYTCLQCGKTMYLSEKDVNSKYIINISYFNYSKIALQIEYLIFMEMFDDLDYNPSMYEIFFTIQTISYIYSCKETLINIADFNEVRKQIIQLIIKKNDENKLNQVTSFVYELMNYFKNSDCKLNELNDKEITYENLKKYGPCILSK